MMKLRILHARFVSKSIPNKIHARILEKTSSSSEECIASTPKDGVRLNQIPYLLEFAFATSSSDDDIMLRIEIKSNNTVHVGEISQEMCLKIDHPVWCNLSAGKDKEEISGCVKIGVARTPRKTKTEVKPSVVLDFDCTVSKHHLWGTLNKWPFCVSNFMEAFPEEKNRPPMDPHDSRFVTYIMGGKDRIDLMRKYFEKLVSIGTTMYVISLSSSLNSVEHQPKQVHLNSRKCL